MKKKLFQVVILVSLLFLGYSIASATEKKDDKWIKRQAFKVASLYARSIACDASLEEKNLIALVPWTNPESVDFDQRAEAEYALLWQGDILCSGGSGSFAPQITIIKIGAGDSFVVDPEASSPIVKFDIYNPSDINRIIKYSKNELLIGTKVLGPNDAHCCPSIPVKILLRRDKKGNWNHVKTIEK